MKGDCIPMKLRRLLSCILALLLAASLPVSALAAEYDLADGSIKVEADASGQYVTQTETGINRQEDANPVITQTITEAEPSTSNTITITAMENATANVTIEDVNIAISDPVDAPKDHSGQAAVTIKMADDAKANVTLDGVNINVGGTGGYNSSQDKYNTGEAAVQITGNGDVTIELDGENTVQSGDLRAGVEKNDGDSSGKLTITDENRTDGSLKATGGVGGSGIGGGYYGNGSNITVSQDAQVKVQGGVRDVRDSGFVGAGASIGNGGAWNTDGEEVTPNTDALTTNGNIEYYAPGADMETEAPYKTVIGTYAPPQDEGKPDQPSQPTEASAAEAVYAAPLYRVINQDGKDILHQDARKDGVLTITVEADFATLTGNISGLKTLKAQGVDTVVFVTTGATSTFAISDLLAQGGDSYALTHDGETVTFTLGNGTDIGKILK